MINRNLTADRIARPSSLQAPGYLNGELPRHQRLREEWVLVHLPLVRKLARHYCWTGVEFEELVQIGVIGLIKACRTYDGARGTKFGSYAYHHIKGELRHYLRCGYGHCRLPRGIAQRSVDVAAAVAVLEQQMGRSPTVAEVAARAGRSEETVREILGVQERPWMHLVGDLDRDLGDEHPSAPRRYGERSALPLEERMVLIESVNHLARVQRKVVYYLFFMDLTQTEAARRLGISQKHVSRLLTEALRHLASLVREAGFETPIRGLARRPHGDFRPALSP